MSKLEIKFTIKIYFKVLMHVDVNILLQLIIHGFEP